MGDSAEVVTDFVGGKEKKEEVNHSEGTGSFRKNGKSNLHSRGVYFHKISIFATVPSSKLATNYSSSPSRSLRILFSLASKVAVSLYEGRGGQRKVAQGDFGTIIRYFGQPWRPGNKVTKQWRGLLIFLLGHSKCEIFCPICGDVRLY